MRVTNRRKLNQFVIIPTFDVSPDAPTLSPITPHFDVDSTNVYYKHWLSIAKTIKEEYKNFDGFVIGSPVHYASASGIATAFLDRAFFVAARSGKPIFKHKPGTAIASARRAGTTATLDQLNKYFTITQMPLISGRYWNMVHGSNPDEVRQDLEGMQNMRILARNMAWHLKCQQAAKEAGVEMPKAEETIWTNFIR